MVVKTIISGDEELNQSNYQIQLLEKAVENLHNLNMDITLELYTGEKIIISKVIEGGDCSTRLLAVTIKK